MKTPRVAFLFTGVGDLSGGGGAERFFYNFFLDYQTLSGSYDLSLITDRSSLQYLQMLKPSRNREKIAMIRIVSNRFKTQLELIQLIWIFIWKRIRLLQLPMYNDTQFELIRAIDRLPTFIRPALVVTIVDAYVPYFYLNTTGKEYNFKRVYGRLFENIKLDGVITWYQYFKEFAQQNNIIRSNPHIFNITVRYTSKQFDRYAMKKKEILFVGRLTKAKNPQMLLDAIKLLNDQGFDFRTWTFKIYGKGPLEDEIKLWIKTNQLSALIEVNNALDMTKALEQSTCYVSTMDYENFPSLSMNEAMAAGNVIIARDVGQTHLFVKDGVNGYLIRPDTVQGLARVLSDIIEQPQKHQDMMQNSRNFTTQIHTLPAFTLQLEDCWKQILS